MKAKAVAPTYNAIWDGGDMRFISWVRGTAYNSNPLATNNCYCSTWSKVGSTNEKPKYC